MSAKRKVSRKSNDVSAIAHKAKDLKTMMNNLKLGITVLVTAAALVLGLYIVGDKKNLFGDTFLVTAQFRDVGGLTIGNNVRFGGIDVGTVEYVDVLTDTSMLVIMRVDERYHKRIHANSVALVTTDGVIGNRLVAISSDGDPAAPVGEGGMIRSINAVSMEETTRTLSATNQNLKEITDNVKHMTQKLDSSALWMVLADSAVAENIRMASYDLRTSMKAISESFFVKGFQRKKEKREPRSDR